MKIQTIFSVLAILCQALSSGIAQFVESHEIVGIDHFSRQNALMGGGAAFFDCDRDGDEDLYLTAGQDIDHFYVNNGDGTFRRDTAAGFSLTGQYYTTGVIAGDIDNDGYKDLFVSTWGSTSQEFAKNLLFYNNGDGTFTEIWALQNPEDLAFSMGATFIDFDLDGLLDIYVINYVKRPEFIYDEDDNIVGFNHECFANALYKNLGGGQFIQWTSQSGLGDTGCALAVTATDYDNDNLLDIYIANDFGPFIQPNKLYRNIGGDWFQNVSESTKANEAMYGMGIAIGDYDNDLDLDYYVTNFGRNVLLENQNGVFFEDVTTAAGVEDTWSNLLDSLMAIGWGTAFFDADNDTDLDLYISNGYVPSPDFLQSQFFQNDRLYLNDSDGTFSNQTDAWGVNNPFVSRGMAYCDYDNDGDLDVISVVLNVPPALGTWRTVLYQNMTNDTKHWMQLQLEGVSVNRDAYGSKVYLYAGDQILMREVSGGASHASHHSTRVHFGLDTISVVDSIRIIWTGGRRIQTLYSPSINQILPVVEDTLISASEYPFLAITDLISVFPNPASQTINYQLHDSNLHVQSILLIDMHGRVRIVFGSPETNLLTLPDLESGVYLLQFITSQGTGMKKLMVDNDR